MARKKDRYAEPVTMTVREALGMKENQFTGEQMARLFPDENSLIADHKADLQKLDRIEERIEKALLEYEKNDEDREPLELVYDQKLRILYGMAGRFHPLSTYGKSMLKKAVACRREFEASVGPLITAIGKNNMELFKTVLSEDLQEDILAGRRSGLGAIRTHKGKTYGVAAIVCYIDRVPSYDAPVLRIEWLYVNDKFRGRGLSVFLLGEVLSRAADLGVAAVSAEFEAGGDTNYLLGYVLGTMQFDPDTGLDPGSLIRIGDITGHTKIASGKKGVSELSSLEPASREKLLKTAFRKFAYKGYMRDLPVTWFDEKTSCFTGTPENVTGLLLSHRLPSGILRAEFEGLTGDREEITEKLVSMFLANAILTCEDDTLIRIPVDSENLGYYLETVCPGQMGRYKVESVLDRPVMDVDEKLVKELMK